MKVRNLLVALVGLMMIGVSSCKGDEVRVKYAELPVPVKQFLGKHFAGGKVKMVKADMDDVTPDYDVMFVNGTKVDVESDGTWTEISNRNGVSPLTMLPDSVQSYISANYPNVKVVKIEQDRKGYEVKLANGAELEFNTQGTFLRADK